MKDHCEDHYKDHCNVLLLALSTFPYKRPMSESKFLWENGKEYTGIYQLDPVPKLLADQLAEKGEYLDKVILLATDATRTEEKEVEITYLNGKKAYYRGTELAYFQSQIESYMNPDSKPEEKFVVVPIDEKNIERGISDTIEKVREIKNIRLYLDTHGGFREIFLVAEAVISLLKIDKIEVQGIYGIEYGQRNRITDGSGGFHIFDFVAGMNEFINYGRINSLEAFLKKNQDSDPDKAEQQEKLISCIKKISEGIQLCGVTVFEKGLDELTEYYNEIDMENFDKHSYLFIFEQNIKNDYGKLLSSDRTVIDEINWCRKKGFYQQVLTLIEGRVPEHLERVELCEYQLRKGMDETEVFNQCVPWRYFGKKKSPQERMEEMEQNWYPRLYKDGNYVKDKNGKYVEDTSADIWMRFRIAEEKRADLEEFLRLHTRLKDIRNQLNHALKTFKKDLPYIDKKITDYLELLEKLCS